jgi:hypothetical protein
MKRIMMIMLMGLMPLALFGGVGIRNIVVEKGCYTAGARITVSYEIWATPRTTAYAEVLFSADAVADANDLVLFNDNGTPVKAAKGPRSGGRLVNNFKARGEWKKVTQTVKLPADLKGTQYIIISLGENEKIVTDPSLVQNRQVIAVYECGNYKPVPVVTPRGTPGR